MSSQSSPSRSDAQPYGPRTFSLSTAEYRQLVEHSPVLIWRSGVDAKCDYFNETWLDFTGRTLEQETGDGWAAGVHPDDLEQCLQRYNHAFQRREPFEIEYRLRRNDGIYRWIEDRGTPLFDDGGAFLGYIGSCMDIEDRRRARTEREEHQQEKLGLYHELHRREARIHRLIDANIVGVACADVDGRVIEANDAFLSIVGYTRDDVKAGRLHRKHLTPDEWQGATDRADVQLQSRGMSDAFEKEYLRKDGTRVPVLVGAASFEGDEQTELVAFVLDLTEAKRAERERERLRQAESDLAYMGRVLTMGELAASIAHDVKQPVTAALANAETCAHLLDRPHPDLRVVREVVADMSIEVRRASDIIDRIRSLYTRGAPRRDPLDVNELVHEMVALLSREASARGVSIRTELEAALPPVTGDRVQLQQVLLNLMLNGIEASKGAPGELVIQTRHEADRGVLIAVSDSGVGLPREHAERIFDAFFTTKPQGTGMGLAISRAIVQAHGGAIWAVENPTAGATFQFTVPN